LKTSGEVKEKVTLEAVLELAEQLPPEEQDELVKRLRSHQRNLRPPLNLPLIDVGPWPDEATLQRDSWYDG
jgi:hypothetical protein